MPATHQRGPPLANVPAHEDRPQQQTSWQQNQDGFQAWQVTHSSIIQVAVETGLPGFIIYFLLNYNAIANLYRIRKMLNAELSLFAFFMVICFCGFWTSALFLTHGYSINLYFLLAISACLRILKKKYDNENFEPEKVR